MIKRSKRMCKEKMAPMGKIQHESSCGDDLGKYENQGAVLLLPLISLIRINSFFIYRVDAVFSRFRSANLFSSRISIALEPY